jgi:DNA-binding LytR/AlgR family response regulator
VIFVTNLAQYAIKGYEVKAFDFIVKPVAYYNFVLKMADALKSINLSRDVEVWIKTNEGMQKLYASQITYIEVIGHYLTYHTTDGDFICNGSITNASDELRASSFSFCNRCYLVNLKYVTQITQTEVVVDGHRLILTRHKRANFVKDLNNFLAGGN